MLKEVKDILNTMGEELTFANSGEMLSTKQKLDVLSEHKGSCL